MQRHREIGGAGVRYKFKVGDRVVGTGDPVIDTDDQRIVVGSFNRGVTGVVRKRFFAAMGVTAVVVELDDGSTHRWTEDRCMLDNAVLRLADLV